MMTTIFLVIFASMKKAELMEGQGFMVTTNLKKISKLDKFVRIVQGGSSRLPL